MELHQVKGLVLREVKYSESDKILTVLTDKYGKISLYGYGLRSYKSHFFITTQPLCYSEFVLTKKGDRYRINDSALIEDFYNLRFDIESYALSQYLIEVTSFVTIESDDQSEILKLLLNTLYALNNKLKSASLLKAAFELRLSSILGFMPNLSACSECGKCNENMILSLLDGVLLCNDCVNKLNEKPISESQILKPVSSPVLQAMRHTIYSKHERVFAFFLSDDLLLEFSLICEDYLLNHIECTFNTLNFYKELTEY